MILSADQIKLLKDHWDLSDEINFHRKVANYVYFAQLEGKEVILRLTDIKHRKESELESELDWMDYLRRRGLRIAAPVFSKQKKFFASLEGFNAALFEKAEGAPIHKSGPVTADKIKIWGQYLGRMHSLTKHYTPSPELSRRYDWLNDSTMVAAKRGLDPFDSEAYARMFEIEDWMKTLPTDQDCYGLLHVDLHHGNFFMHHDQLTAFDFDDSCYNWFSYDIIVPLLSLSVLVDDKFTTLSKDKTKELFLEGYHRENKLSQIWIDRLPIFEKFRAIIIYHWLKALIFENPDDEKMKQLRLKVLPYWVELYKGKINFL